MSGAVQPGPADAVHLTPSMARRTAFMAARRGDVEQLARLLDTGMFSADAQHESSIMGGRCLLHEAAMANQPGSLRALAGRGANLEITDNDGFTPLAVAVRMQCWGAVRTLAELGAEVHCTVRRLIHPWGYWVEVAGAVTAGAITRETMIRGVDEINAAMCRWRSGERRSEWKKEWTDRESGWLKADWAAGSALHAAAKGWAAQAVLLLIEAGHDPLVLNQEGKTARDLADDEGRAVIDAWLARHAVQAALRQVSRTAAAGAWP